MIYAVTEFLSKSLKAYRSLKGFRQIFVIFMLNIAVNYVKSKCKIDGINLKVNFCVD